MSKFLRKNGNTVFALFSLFGLAPVFYVVKSASGHAAFAAIAFSYVWVGVHALLSLAEYTNDSGRRKDE